LDQEFLDEVVIRGKAKAFLRFFLREMKMGEKSLASGGIFNAASTFHPKSPTLPEAGWIGHPDCQVAGWAPDDARKGEINSAYAI
jgi:hypothetical protein